MTRMVVNRADTAVRSASRATQATAQVLGAHIRAARRRRRWSEAEAAERAHIARATLQKIERGGLGVALGLVLELCTVLGVSVLDGSLSLPVSTERGPPVRAEPDDDF